MRRRRWLLLVAGLVLVTVTLVLVLLPTIARRVAIARIHTLTGRPVAIERVDVNLFTGRVAVTGFRLDEPDGRAPFADFARLDLRLHLPSLLIGHLWIRDIALYDS